MQILPSGAPLPVSIPSPSSQKKTTVLIIDNEVSIRLCVKMGFEREDGFNFLEARNVEQAIRLLNDSNNKIDYVICDGFGDHVGGEFSEFLDGFSSSLNNGASLIIYTGERTPEMVKAINERSIICEIVDKCRVVPHKLVEKVLEMREVKAQALVQNAPPTQTVPNAALVALGGEKTLLVVDDYNFTFTDLQEGLQDYGEPFNLIYAPTVAEAKRILAKQNVDIVLSDGFVDGIGGTLSELLPAIKPGVRLLVNTASPRSVNNAELDRAGLNYAVIDKMMTNKALVQLLMKEGGVAGSEVLPVAETTVPPQRLDIRMPLDEVTEGVLKTDLGANQKILVVDDCPETTARLSRVLGKYFTADRGNKIFVANNAFDAKQIIEREGITLLCTDLYMEPESGIREHPELTNGDELLKELGGDGPSAVLVSGSWSDDIYANVVRAKDMFMSADSLEYILRESTADHRLANAVVPILGASKTRVFYDEASLVTLCLSALSMGRDKQPDIMARFLETLDIKMKEDEKLENGSIVKLEEALLLAQAEFLQMKDRVNQDDFAVGREELEQIQQGIEKEFSAALRITRKLYDTENKTIGLHDIVNKRASIASCVSALSTIFQQGGKSDLAIMARECERLILEHTGSVLKSSKARIEALAGPQDFVFEDEIKTLISSEFPTAEKIIQVSSSNTLTHGLKSDYVDLIKQLVMNSIKAVKGTADPNIAVNISETSSSIEMIVSDNGCGMNAEQLRKMQERKSLPSSWGTGGEGMGFIYKTLAKLNADMEVNSAGEGMGATFKITIPKNMPTTSELPRRQQSQPALV